MPPNQGQSLQITLAYTYTIYIFVSMKLITLLAALLLTAPIALAFDTDSEVESRVSDFLNTSTPAELVQVKGIGNVLSARIIAARPFKAPQEVLKVKGIGEVKAQSIYDFALTSWNK